MSDASDVARTYYRSLDDHDYDRLHDLLAPDVVHRRPDRTFEGRESLVSFMRDDRPNVETSHEIEAIYAACGDGDRNVEDTDGTGDADGTDVAVRGRLLDAGDDPLFAFVDVLALTAGRIGAIETFTR